MDHFATADPAATPRNDAFLVGSQGTSGLTHKQTRSARFIAPSRGVRYARESSDPELARTTAASMASRPGAVLVDTTAARAWDLPLPPWLALSDEPLVAVAVPAGRPRPQRRDIRGRRLRLPPEHLGLRDGNLITLPARTWLDCAALVPVEHVVAMGDAVLARQLATRDELAAIVRWGRRRRGIVPARSALPMLDSRAESPGESLTRAHLLLGGVPRPECNLDIVCRGEWLARADLAWPTARLIVEYDGAVHGGEAQRRRDAARRNLLQDCGWLVIVFTSADLRQPWAMVGLVQSTLRARANLGVPRANLAEW